MRYLGMFLCLALLAAASGRGDAQVAAQSTAEPVFEPYSKHHDTRFGHDHFYPDRGAIVRDVPKDAMVVNYAGVAFHFHDGIWYEPRGPAYMVVAPPIGLLVSSLPGFATLLARNGQIYIYCNDTYYRPRPDVNGYEVTNDPSEPTFQVAADSEPNSVRPAAVGGAGAVAGSASAASSPTTAAPSPTTAPSSPATVATALQDPAEAIAPMPLHPVSATPAANVQAVPAVALQSGPAAQAAAPVVASAPRALATPASFAVSADPAPEGSDVPVIHAVAAASTVTGTAAPTVTSVVNAPTVTSAPVPVAAVESSPLQSRGAAKLFLYPRNGQNADQQARDRYECYRFAAGQTGFDPMRPGSAGTWSDYDRAQAACFEGRGYTVR